MVEGKIRAARCAGHPRCAWTCVPRDWVDANGVWYRDVAILVQWRAPGPVSRTLYYGLSICGLLGDFADYDEVRC